jgi:hypothetical protein
VPEHHHESRSGPCRREFYAADLGWGDDVAGDADNEQVPQTLIENDLRRHPRVGAAENDGERLLTGSQFAPPHLVGERIMTRSTGYESAVAVSQSF